MERVTNFSTVSCMRHMSCEVAKVFGALSISACNFLNSVTFEASSEPPTPCLRPDPGVADRLLVFCFFFAGVWAALCALVRFAGLAVSASSDSSSSPPFFFFRFLGLGVVRYGLILRTFTLLFFFFVLGLHGLILRTFTLLAFFFGALPVVMSGTFIFRAAFVAITGALGR